jgi:hypothetical protein
MDITVNTTRTIKLQSQAGLTDVVLTVYDSSQGTDFTGTMTEVLPGVYELDYTPDTIGNYTAVISSVSFGQQTAQDIRVLEDATGATAWTQSEKDEVIDWSKQAASQRLQPPVA